ncbi:MAG: imidazole glycerol phosphate synthase subunit HisF [Planctomycetes bacterium]|nr:imidazole glycerol phosphate synthase subunit HisF [Planctomycetota bacterium]
MLKSRIIPCLDVKDGRVVKGTNFASLRDVGDPVELAKRYCDEGADELVYLDISATVEGRKTFLDTLERTADSIFLPLTVGGGIRVVDDIRRLLGAGADKVSLNTAAVANPDFISEASGRFGCQCVVIAIDVKKGTDGITNCELRITNESKSEISNLKSQIASGYEVVTHAGRRPTGIDALSWAREAERRGAGEILLTSMDADGTKNGYDLEITSLISGEVGVPVIASGGAGKPEHLFDALTTGGADAVLVAGILHFGTYTVASLRDYLRGRGIKVRSAS